MTKQTLEEAVKLQEKIKYFRKEKENHEGAEKKCWGNFSEVVNRKFFIVIKEQNNEKIEVQISADVARKALREEIRVKSELLAKLEEEFAKL